MRNHRLLFSAPLFAAALPLSALASGPAVTIGTIGSPAGQPATVQISVTDADAPAADDIEGMTFTLQIAAGTGTNPAISSIDLLTNTVWASAANASDIYPNGAAQPQYESLGIITNTEGQYINANGLLATVKINTEGATLGNYTLELTGTKTAADDSAFSNGLGVTVPTTFATGQLTITTPNLMWDNAGASGDGLTWNTTQQNFNDGTVPSLYVATDPITFNDTNNNHYTVNIPAAVSPASVAVSAAGNYTFTGAGGIAGSGMLTKSGAGTLTISSPLSYTGATTISAGKLSLATNLTSTSGISIASGATLQLQKSTSINTANLTLAAGSILDITSNTETFNTSITGHSAATLTSLLKSAYDAGKWDAAGITSSTAAATRGTTLGYSVSGSIFTIKYTWLGDANLDGIVNSSDLSAIAPAGTTWSAGDFNYDGKVNADDYALFMLGSAESGGQNISVTLPEPAIAAPLVIAAMFGARRRRH